MKRGELITIGEESHTLKAWCRLKGLNYGSVWSRIERGMDLAEAILTPNFVPRFSSSQIIQIREACASGTPQSHNLLRLRHQPSNHLSDHDRTDIQGHRRSDSRTASAENV